MNLKNRTIFNRDNLDILKGINSNCIDLIYLDPPFNKNKEFTAPMGSSAEGASFKDWFREADVKDEWLQEIKEDYDGLHTFLTSVKNLSNITVSKNNKHYLYNYCYLSYMAIRLIEMRRILKDTGSIYLHCDPTMSHYIKILMDIIFGEKNFRNEIIWNYNKMPNNLKAFQKNNDIVLLYTKSHNYNFNVQYGNYSKSSLKTYNRAKKIGYNINYNKKMATVFDWDKYNTAIKNKVIKNADKLQPVFFKGEGSKLSSVWDIPILAPSSKERTGYPTQKPLALLERIIKASSNEKDIVLDPFCGCATTCIASEKLNRQWAGIDISVKAYELVKERLEKEIANPEDLTQYQIDVDFQTDPPKRTDTNGDTGLSKKYVYVISHPNFKKSNLYKVGTASDLKSRLNSYHTSDPLREYKLEHNITTPYFREIENYIHKKFSFSHEWVSGKLEDIIREIENFSIDDYNQMQGELSLE